VPEARPLTKVWLPAQLLDELAVAADEWKPLEAGGVLAGYWSTKHVEAIVTHVIDAGPHAEHRKDGMAPDTHYQESELDRVFAETDHVSYYLGDWHSHPGMGAVPSPIDRRTLRRIALHHDALAPRPLMLILDNAEDEWGVIGWQARFGRLGRFGFIHVDPIELVVG
jgi:integrative and conjugative element protein (TIGR02256 family)